MRSGCNSPRDLFPSIPWVPPHPSAPLPHLCSLAEVFSLKSYKIDHVVHGAVASAAVYGAIVGATPAQIESAIGMARCCGPLSVPW